MKTKKDIQNSLNLIEEALDRSLRYYIVADINIRKINKLDPDPINEESRILVEEAQKQLKYLQEIL